MDMQVSGLSMFAMTVAMIAGLAIPVVLLIVLVKKYKCKLIHFFVGCGTFFVFAFLLEPILHNIVLGGVLGQTLTNNIWLYGLYGALAAATFEEVGRFLAMKFILARKNEAVNAGTGPALMYGAGHGGIECFLILFTGMMSNLVVSVMINSGNLSTLTATMTGDTYTQFMQTVETLCTIGSGTFLVGIFERICAVTGQILMSMIMWKAVTGKNTALFFAAAFAVHFIMDFVAVIMNYYFGIVVTEICILVLVLIVLFLTRKLYKNEN